jgi:hypothetical protein
VEWDRYFVPASAINMKISSDELFKSLEGNDSYRL